jgi:hypothetical protein
MSTGSFVTRFPFGGLKTCDPPKLSRDAERQIADCRPMTAVRASDYAEQPQDQDQDQQSTKSDIHDVPPYGLYARTASKRSAFQTLRRRIN